ncbi:MAG: nicotinamide-nucleotide amidohydrolase family protein [Clostridiales bacterium]|nr:nicotinamide-nucleotide amidohydrolase family protein [Clostridiales bacterium]
MNAALLVESLIKNRRTIALAESCTGGGIAAALTAVPGSSQCFGLGVVSYGNRAKEELLRVPAEVLLRFGAVSAQTAAQMAAGARELAGADYALAVTGVAGPGGGTPEKPVGLVYISFCGESGLCVTRQYHFTGDREAVRRQTGEAALELALELIGTN